MKNNLYKRLNKDDAVVLMVDHQTGLISGLVRDWNVDTFNQNVNSLVDIAKYFNLPTICTTSFEQGPNGPLLSYITDTLGDATFIKRPGQINAWDNEELVAEIKKTGKKQLIIAGVVTEVCVAFPALSAIAEGYEVFVVVDASGTINKEVASAALTRIAQAGAQLMSWFSVASELQRDWRNDVEGFGELLGKNIPSYANVIESFNAAKEND